MHVPLHESTPDFPLRKFRIVRGNGHETRFSHLDHLSIMVIRLPDEQFSLHLIQDAQPIRFLWHVQRVEKRLRFHRCSVEIVGDYQNPIAAPFPVSNFHRLPSPVSLAHYASGPTPLALIHVDVYRTAPCWHGGRRMRPKREQQALAGGRGAGRTAAPRNSGETHCPTAR
jgi:hypothetical protein